jgi:hypothetical protein
MDILTPMAVLTGSMSTAISKEAVTTNPRDTVAAVRQRLAERFSIEHVTVQIEEDACVDEHEHELNGPHAKNCN